MTDLETRLREVDLPEPPLGFDPDEVADRAARHTRRRRAGITGTLAVFSAAAAAAVFAPGTSPVPPAAPPSSPSPPSPAEQARIRQALADAVIGVFPGVRGLTVGVSPADAIGPGRMAVTATFADAAGRPGNFQLTVYGRGTPDDHVPVARSCPEPDTGGLRCDRIPQPGGAVLLVSEVGYVSTGGFTKLRGFDSVLRRADGSAVTLTDAADDAADSVQLSEEQLTKVITDPAFVLP
ncbi:hypothetical protein [Amycolatopsis rifamycinica]|uniref:Uncharacterized protein n=1 Tax=Amycolatopsis rifamycinica TaxID=287986 RepID=A0A066UAP7_9PSEU|nr:hypothetical protein [Amycolatopsis rifamycinica]KDN21303.1 hypothetical protein DV20_15550 [Amycolatopsis rifamycinica]